MAKKTKRKITTNDGEPIVQTPIEDVSDPVLKKLLSEKPTPVSSVIEDDEDDAPAEMSRSIPEADSTYQFSIEELKEFEKCMDDPKYFIRTYVRIQNLDSQELIPFKLHKYQEKMVDAFQNNRFIINMCSRQVGKSTTTVAWMLHYIIFNSQKTVCISANKQLVAKELLDRMKQAYELLPRFLQHGVVEWNKFSIKLANGSRAFSASTSSSSVRGGSYNVLLLDEFAHIHSNIAEDFYASTFPTISSGQTTKIIIVSTPKGVNLFKKLWDGAINGENDFFPIFVNWDAVPGRDDAWRKMIIRNVGPERFAQEFECSFLVTQYTLVNGRVLGSLKSKKEIHGDELGYKEFYPYQPNRHYVMTVDTGRGIGKDYSAFTITDTTTLPYRVVATFMNNHISSIDFAMALDEYAKKWDQPWLLIETMAEGLQVAMIMWRDYSYPKMLTSRTTKHGIRLHVGGVTDKRYLGVDMKVGVRRRGASTMKHLIERKQIITTDARINNQLTTFVLKGTKYEASENCHDDLVMTLMVLAWASTQQAFTNVTEQKIVEAYSVRDLSSLNYAKEVPNGEPQPDDPNVDFEDDDDEMPEIPRPPAPVEPSTLPEVVYTNTKDFTKAPPSPDTAVFDAKRMAPTIHHKADLQSEQRMMMEANSTFFSDDEDYFWESGQWALS